MLMTRYKRLLTEALRADPTYVEKSRADGTRVLNEVNTFKITIINATQSDFSQLKGSE